MSAAPSYAAALALLARATPVPRTDSAPRSSSASVAPPGGAGDSPEPPDDAWRLMVLLGMFVVSPLVVVGALWAVAAIDTWWALAGALGVYLTASAAAFATVAFVLSEAPPLPRARRRDG